MQCEQIRDLLEAYAVGTLDEDQRAAVEAHLADCAACQRMADELIATCNLFGYGEIGEEGSSSYRRSSGALLSIFNDRLQHKDRFVGVRIDDKEDVYPALKQFFGRRGVETPA